MNLPMIPFPKLLCHAHRSHSLMAAEAQKAQQSQTSRDFTRGRSPKRRGLRARGLTMPHPSTNTTNTTAILQQAYSNTHYGTVPTTSMRGLPSTNFHQFPPGNNFLVHCERIVTSSRCCKQRSGARKT